MWLTMRESGMSALWLKQILFTVFTTLGCLVHLCGWVLLGCYVWRLLCSQVSSCCMGPCIPETALSLLVSCRGPQCRWRTVWALLSLGWELCQCR
jgi:hypothetical protein